MHCFSDVSQCRRFKQDVTHTNSYDVEHITSRSVEKSMYAPENCGGKNEHSAFYSTRGSEKNNIAHELQTSPALMVELGIILALSSKLSLSIVLGRSKRFRAIRFED